MALNVANWTDKQLDELTDLLRTADHSEIATFVFENFLATAIGLPAGGGRIMSDSSHLALTCKVNTSDHKAVDLEAGIFLHGSPPKVSQLDSTQTCNVLLTTVGAWGTGKAATGNRWTKICVTNDIQLHTPQNRWFVDDGVDPNSYSEASVNTMINKAYYDIAVVHGDDGQPITHSSCAVPAGYWCIAEIYIPSGTLDLTAAGVTVRDTTDIPSNDTPLNWTATTRVMRMEFYGGFEIGTKMPFYQAAAPVGWTQDVTINDRALRVVGTAGGGQGGSLAFSSPTVGSHTLSIAEMPAHTHDYYTGTAVTVFHPDSHFYVAWNPGMVASASTGGGGGHDHPLALAYIDVIVCTKNY